MIINQYWPANNENLTVWSNFLLTCECYLIGSICLINHKTDQLINIQYFLCVFYQFDFKGNQIMAEDISVIFYSEGECVFMNYLSLVPAP